MPWPNVEAAWKRLNRSWDGGTAKSSYRLLAISKQPKQRFTAPPPVVTMEAESGEMTITVLWKIPYKISCLHLLHICGGQQEKALSHYSLSHLVTYNILKPGFLDEIKVRKNYEHIKNFLLCFFKTVLCGMDCF